MLYQFESLIKNILSLMVVGTDHVSSPSLFDVTSRCYEIIIISVGQVN